MNRKTSYLPPTADDERIKQMRNGLQQLRQDVIATAPWKLREMVTWWIDLKPDFNLYSWQQELIAKVLENTEVTTPAINFYFKDRAPCPLCGDSPDSEPAGFAVPTGLERHLEEMWCDCVKLGRVADSQTKCDTRERVDGGRVSMVGSCRRRNCDFLICQTG